MSEFRDLRTKRNIRRKPFIADVANITDLWYTHVPMIAHLHGTVHRLNPERVTVDVNGVGYKVAVPLPVWEQLAEGEEAMLHIFTYVREDRLELYGFSDEAGRALFEKFLDMDGVGPKSALELSGVPRSLLMQAIGSDDSKLLTSVKGIGKKTAEKLLVDLRSLAEKEPNIFGGNQQTSGGNQFDRDAVEALKSLGYDTSTIMHALKQLSPELTSTEERVTAALRSL